MVKLITRLFLIILISAFYISCTRSNPVTPPHAPGYPKPLAGTIEKLPDKIAQFPVWAGMSRKQVKKLKLSYREPVTSDTSEFVTVLRDSPANDPWSGFYTIEYHNSIVSRVMFHRGSLSIVHGQWILSELQEGK